MARKTQVILIDDIDGGIATETVTFAIDGTAYEIDPSTAHANELRDALENFLEAGTRMGRYSLDTSRTPARSAPVARAAVDREQNKAIREWPEQTGKQPRGRTLRQHRGVPGRPPAAPASAELRLDSFESGGVETPATSGSQAFAPHSSACLRAMRTSRSAMRCTSICKRHSPVTLMFRSFCTIA